VEIVLLIVGLAVASMAIGLVVSAGVRTADTTMPLLVVVTMVQVVLSGALMSLTGRPVLNALSLLSPSRWALAATASTIDLNTLLPPLPSRPPDGMWRHQPVTWLQNTATLVGLTAVLALILLWQLRRLDPGRRPGQPAIVRAGDHG